MEKEELKDKKKSSYWWIIILIIILGVWIYVKNQPDEDKTFVVTALSSWYACWGDTSSINVNWEISSSSPVDLFFTPTSKDVENLNETAQHYPLCYSPNVLSDKGVCTIAGKGCVVLLNKNTNDATISLKYSAKKIEG